MRPIGWCAAMIGGWIALTATVGCDDERPLAFEEPQPISQPSNQPQPAAQPAANAEFDPRACGSVRGFIRWTGPLPTVPTIDHPEVVAGSSIAWTKFANPHAPRVDPHSLGVGDAVVYLRGVSPMSSLSMVQRARRWDHPPVRVEARERLLHVHQGPRIGLVGVVRVGDQIELVSRSQSYHAVAGRGAAFFAATLPVPDRPVTRQLTTPGLVELTSAAGHYWARAWLFVCEHPYWTLTNPDGSFAIEQVPAGQYELVVWHANPHICARQRDPESTLVTRLTFAAPLEWKVPVVVEAGGQSPVCATLNESLFPRACP
jgi:hypothetical protein